MKLMEKLQKEEKEQKRKNNEDCGKKMLVELKNLGNKFKSGIMR